MGKNYAVFLKPIIYNDAELVCILYYSLLYGPSIKSRIWSFFKEMFVGLPLLFKWKVKKILCSIQTSHVIPNRSCWSVDYFYFATERKIEIIFSPRLYAKPPRNEKLYFSSCEIFFWGPQKRKLFFYQKFLFVCQTIQVCQI